MTPLKIAWHHIRRSPFQSLIAVAVMTVSFFSLSVFLIISQGMSSVLDYFETKPEITIFLKDGLDHNTVVDLQKELSDYQKIKEIKFISKDKALEIYKEQNKSNPLLTEMVTASILPASFEVSVSDPKILEQISLDFSAKSSQIDEIIYQKDIINSLLTWTDIIRKVGISAVLATSTITLLIIVVIISMKITNRKEEINISRLLGASSFYVKRPFLIEGVIYGLTGSFLGFLTTYSLLGYFYQQINHFFNPIVFVISDISFYVSLASISLFFGGLIGFIASWIGVKRNIRF